MKNSIKNFYIEISAFFTPILNIILLVLLFYIPRSDNYWNLLRQAPFYTGIYFWLSQRPDIFNVLSAFILGIFADVLGGVPIGINILTFLILYIIAVQFSLRFNIKKFSYSWLLFITALLITFIFKALMVSILYRQIIPLNLWSIELLLTCALYPLLARIYIWIERRYIHLEERYEKIQP